MGLILLVVVSINNFPVANTAKASKLLGDENFRSAVTEAGGSEKETVSQETWQNC